MASGLSLAGLLKLTRESQYALKAMAYLAEQPPGTVLRAQQVADGARIAGPFAAKILLQLRGGGLLLSHRGSRRGYELARAPGEISVREVLEAVEGEGLFQRCVFWSHTCSEANPCELHPVWMSVRPQVAALMGRLTLADVIHSDFTAVVPHLRFAAPDFR